MAVWNEPDAERRRAAVRELWTADASTSSSRRRRCGRPPAPRLRPLVLEARGHDALEARVTRAYQEFVARAPSCSAPPATPIGSATWSSSAGRWCPATAATWPGRGLEVLVLDADGRIAADYQFIES